MGFCPGRNGNMWYEDPRDNQRDEKEDRQKIGDQEKQFELGEDETKPEPDYKYTDWASI